MKFLRNSFLLVALVGAFSPSHAVMIWTGPDVFISQPADAPLSVTDVLVPGAASLSRGSAGLLCNLEVGDSCQPNLFFNPSNFEFAFSGLNGNGVIAYGSAANYAALNFSDLDAAWVLSAGFNAPGSVGVGRIVSLDIYFDIEFSDWGRGANSANPSIGSFAYRRSSAAVVVPEPTTLVLMGLGIAGFGFRRKMR
ncbi:MAG: PEP-CTERM sorting domain-containing protein [Pseudomonadota bacterium]